MASSGQDDAPGQVSSPARRRQLVANDPGLRALLGSSYRGGATPKHAEEPANDVARAIFRAYHAVGTPQLKKKLREHYREVPLFDRPQGAEAAAALGLGLDMARLADSVDIDALRQTSPDAEANTADESASLSRQRGKGPQQRRSGSTYGAGTRGGAGAVDDVESDGAADSEPAAAAVDLARGDTSLYTSISFSSPLPFDWLRGGGGGSSSSCDFVGAGGAWLDPLSLALRPRASDDDDWLTPAPAAAPTGFGSPPRASSRLAAALPPQQQAHAAALASCAHRATALFAFPAPGAVWPGVLLEVSAGASERLHTRVVEEYRGVYHAAVTAVRRAQAAATLAAEENARRRAAREAPLFGRSSSAKAAHRSGSSSGGTSGSSKHRSAKASLGGDAKRSSSSSSSRKRPTVGTPAAVAALTQTAEETALRHAVRLADVLSQRRKARQQQLDLDPAAAARSPSLGTPSQQQQQQPQKQLLSAPPLFAAADDEDEEDEEQDDGGGEGCSVRVARGAVSPSARAISHWWTDDAVPSRPLLAHASDVPLRQQLPEEAGACGAPTSPSPPSSTGLDPCFPWSLLLRPPLLPRWWPGAEDSGGGRPASTAAPTAAAARGGRDRPSSEAGAASGATSDAAPDAAARREGASSSSSSSSRRDSSSRGHGVGHTSRGAPPPPTVTAIAAAAPPPHATPPLPASEAPPAPPQRRRFGLGARLRPAADDGVLLADSLADAAPPADAAAAGTGPTPARSLSTAAAASSAPSHASSSSSAHYRRPAVASLSDASTLPSSRLQLQGRIVAAATAAAEAAKGDRDRDSSSGHKRRRDSASSSSAPLPPPPLPLADALRAAVRSGQATPLALTSLRPAEREGIAAWTRRCVAWQHALCSAWSLLLHASAAALPHAAAEGEGWAEDAPPLAYFCVRFGASDVHGNVLTVVCLPPPQKQQRGSGSSGRAVAVSRIVAVMARSDRLLRRRLADAGVPFETPLDAGLTVPQAAGAAAGGGAQQQPPQPEPPLQPASPPLPSRGLPQQSRSGVRGLPPRSPPAAQSATNAALLRSLSPLASPAAGTRAGRARIAPTAASAAAPQAPLLPGSSSFDFDDEDGEDGTRAPLLPGSSSFDFDDEDGEDGTGGGGLGVDDDATRRMVDGRATVADVAATSLAASAALGVGAASDSIRGSEFSPGSAVLVRGGAAVALLLDALLQGASPTWPVIGGAPASSSNAGGSSSTGSSIAGLALRSAVPLSTFALPSAGSNHAVRTLAASGTLGGRLDLPQILSPTPFRHGAAVPTAWRFSSLQAQQQQQQPGPTALAGRRSQPHPPQGQQQQQQQQQQLLRHTVELRGTLIPAPLARVLAAAVRQAHQSWHDSGAPQAGGLRVGGSDSASGGGTGVSVSAHPHLACAALSGPVMRAAVLLTTRS